MEITLGQFRSREMSLPVGKRYLPTGKRANVISANERTFLFVQQHDGDDVT